MAPSPDVLETVFQSSTDCIKLLNLDAVLLAMNAGGAVAMDLVDATQFVGRDWLSFWTGSERQAAEEAFATASRGGTARFEGRLPTAKGRLKIWDSVVSPITGADGAVHQLLVMSRDVTEQRCLLQQLEDATRRTNAIIQATSEIIWHADPQQQRRIGLHALAGAAEAVTDRSAWLAQIHPDDVERIDAASRAGVTAGVAYVCEYRLGQPGSDHRWMEDRVVPLRDPDDRLVEWVGVTTDIHDRVMAHQALSESEERLRRAVEASHVGIWDVDLLTGLRRWSKESKAIFGLADDHPESQELLFSLVHPDDRAVVEEAHRAAFANTAQLTFRIRRFDTGEERWVVSSGKPVLDASGRPVRRFGTLQDITERKRAEEKLWWAASHDPLTDLPNRALFAANLDRALANARREGSRVALLVLDLDHFKEVNDTLGHEAGDAVLRCTAERLSAAAEGPVTIARLGGDEFAMLVPEAGEVGEIASRAAALVADLARPVPFGNTELNCPTSLGVAIYPDHDGDGGELLKNADVALYAAKRSGRARFATFDPAMKSAIQKRVAVLRKAREILAGQSIEPFYQPKVTLTGSADCTFEALLRWRDASGLQSPAGLAAAFEEPELAAQIGERMLTLVAADVLRWRAAGLPVGSIAVNVSAAEFLRVDVARQWLSVLERTGLPASALQVEVTEDVFLGEGADAVGRALATLHDRGIAIALDDFGTGFASLTHLRRYPVDWIKLDQSFVGDLGREQDARAIVSAVIDLAHGIGLQVVAEGVETVEQAAILAAKGCDLAQGFLIARPMPASRVPHFVRNWTGLQIDPASGRRTTRLPPRRRSA